MGTKSTLGPTEFHEQQQKTYIFQNMFFWVPQKNESQTGLEWHDNE